MTSYETWNKLLLDPEPNPEHIKEALDNHPRQALYAEAAAYIAVNHPFGEDYAIYSLVTVWLVKADVKRARKSLESIRSVMNGLGRAGKLWLWRADFAMAICTALEMGCDYEEVRPFIRSIA